MPGTILSVSASIGATVKKGEPILIMEAMKMELTLTAPFDGTLTTLSATPGAKIPEGTPLAQITPTP
jgi:biotin carboxyl carrier protein